MHRVVVSHEDESIHSAHRLGRLLRDHFGADEVFLADSVDAGKDATTAAAAALRHCVACIVVVGPSWTDDADPAGRRPNESTPVVRQVRAVLERGVPVLPVLVDGARPPRADDLPESVRGLARLQAVRLDHLTFRSDAGRVVEWADTAVRGERPVPRRRPAMRRPDGRPRTVPVLRTLWRIALWWMIFLLALPAGGTVVGLLVGRDGRGSLGVSIAILLIPLLLLWGCAGALRAEIHEQRLLVSREDPSISSSRARRAVSRGRVRFLAVTCVVVSTVIGLALATI